MAQLESWIIVCVFFVDSAPNGSRSVLPLATTNVREKRAGSLGYAGAAPTLRTTTSQGAGGVKPSPHSRGADAKRPSASRKCVGLLKKDGEYARMSRNKRCLQ